MEIPVLIEPVAGNGYRARGSAPFAYTTEGTTPEEAVRNLQLRIDSELAGGAQVITLKVPAAENPWSRYAGMFKDDPMFAEVMEIMAEQRRQADADPDVL